MLGNFTNKSDVSATAMCTYGTLATGCGFEKSTTATATTEVHYIQAEGRKVAVHSSPSSTEDETRYLHGDHLGSIVLVTDEDGNVEGERYSFDAVGRRRNGSDWTDTLTALVNPDTTLGYTGQESIDAVDIVHMNGLGGCARGGRRRRGRVHPRLRFGAVQLGRQLHGKASRT